MNNQSQLLQAFQSNFECSICLLLFENPVTIPCGHTFCKECITNSVKTHPRCPTCRFTITSELSKLKENLLIKSTVNDLKSLQESKTQNENQRQNLQMQGSDNDVEKLLYITSDHVITPHQFQRIELDQKQFKKRKIANNLLLQAFKHITKFVIAPTNQRHQIGYLATLQLVQIVDGRIEAQILPESTVEIVSISETEFAVGDNALIKYTLPVATAKIIEEEYIDLKDKDIQNQVVILIQQIRSTLNPFIAQLNNSQTQLELSKFLAQSGLMMYLGIDIENDWKSLKRFSFLLPSLLHIPMEQKQLIMSQNNCISRLMMINKNLQRFSNITNPLAVFDIHRRNQKKHYQMEIFVIIIAFLFALWYRI